MTKKHPLEAMIEEIIIRDNSRIKERRGLISKRIWLADERAKDALSAITILVRYIIKQEERAAENKNV